MTRAIDFHFDFVSPYSYLAITQLPALARQHGAEVVYKPFRLLELMKLVGNRPTTVECKNKLRYAGGPPSTASPSTATHTRASSTALCCCAAP